MRGDNIFMTDEHHTDLVDYTLLLAFLCLGTSVLLVGSCRTFSEIRLKIFGAAHATVLLCAQGRPSGQCSTT